MGQLVLLQVFLLLQLENDDLNQIDADDLEEMDPKWKGHFTRECRSPKDTRRNVAVEPQRRNVLVETSTSNALVSQCDESVEARLLVYQQNETVFEEDIKLLKLNVQLRDNALVILRQKFKKAEQERDELKLKLEKFQISSKNLRTFMPPKPDLVFHDAPNVNKTAHTAFNVELSPTKPDKDLNHAQRGNHQQYARMTLSNPKRHVVPTAVLTKSKLIPLTAARQVTTSVSPNNVTRPRPAKTVVTKPHSPPRKNINYSPSPKASTFPLKATAAKAPMVNVVKGVQGNWNMSYLSDFEEINGGYVAFGGNPKGGKISGKGKIRTGKLDFDDVYFVKEIKFNLFCISQMCDKKNSVLFTNTECLVLSPEFKLLDENQVLLKVPKENNIVNGTEFKNNDLNQFCGIKGIRREFSVPRIPQQNGITERKNRTLIEATRTMLADSVLLIPFWDEAINTACYVQNRVLVTKPQNKTPYERLLGRTPSIGFMRPFGCPVTILNTLDPLGKFNGKADGGFLVGYSVVVLHGCLIDTLIKTTNYQIVTASNQSNLSVGIQEQFDTEKAGEKNVQQYVLFPLWSSGSKNPQNTDDDAAFGSKKPEFEGEKPESEVHVSPSSSAQTKKHDDKTKTETKGKSPVELSIGYRNLSAKFKDFSDNSINEVNAADSPVPVVRQISTHNTNNFSTAGHSNTTVSPTHGNFSYVDTSQYPDDPNMPELEDITYSDDEEDVGAEADFTNLETIITVSHIPTTRVHKDHPMTQIIGDLSLVTQTRSMTMVVKDQGGLTQINNEDFYTCIFACFLSQEEPKRVHQALKDPSWIEAMQEELLQFKMQKVWVLVDLPNGKRAIGFEDPDYPDKRGKIDQTLFIKRQKGDILLVQIYVDDIIFGSIDKDLCKAFEKLMKDKFQMSSMGEHKFFLGLQVKQKPDGIFISQDKYVAEILRKFGLTNGKSASTPIDTEKPLLKDPDGEDVDVHTYRSMIGSSMYLTSSRPDIMFTVCALMEMIRLSCGIKSQAGFESRPPMLNKENYVPWSSCLLRYAKSRPNGKLIHNSILNGPYVKKMIPKPGDVNREIIVTETIHLQTDDELSDKELKQIKADDQAIHTILLSLPEDIYAAVDSCETA
nr:putative ribonuclease H-like domain-containing protein [Tanacetum cinerariifolium]